MVWNMFNYVANVILVSQKESVDLILNILDGGEYRGHTIHVERAQFTMKGDFDPTKKKKKLSNREKKKFRERQAKYEFIHL